MLAAVAKLDGLNALLFHVEQYDNRPWEYRVAAGVPEWSEAAVSCNASETVALRDFHKPFLASWRWVGEGDDAWRWALPHEFGKAECEFIVRIAPGSAFPKNEEFRACCLVAGHSSVWLLDLKSWEIKADKEQTLRVRGRSLCQGIGQILQEPGDFQCKDQRFSIINAGPAQNALISMAQAMPGKQEFRGLYMVKAGRLTDEEIEMLKQS